LTPAEQQWLSEHKDIRLGIDSSWPPFEFLDDSGNYAGMSAGYITVLNRRLSVSMEPVLGLSWPQVINKIKQGDLDLLPAVMRTPQREKFLNFTQPYISYPMVIAIRRGEDALIGSLNDLKGKRIGVVKGYASVDLLKVDHPDLILVEKTNVVQLLRDLDEGEIDAAVENVGVISYEIEKLNLNNVQIAAPTPYSYDISIGVRKDWPELVSIIDKAIASLDKEEKEAIKNTWMAHQVKFGLDTKTILFYAAPVVAGVLIIILVIVIRNRRLSGEIAERKNAELKIRAMSDASHDAMIMINSQGEVMFWNESAEAMFGYTDAEVRGTIMHTLFVPQEFRDDAQKGLRGFAKTGKGPVIGEVIEHGAIRRNGTPFPVEIAVTSFEMDDGWYAVGSIRDITQRKKDEQAVIESEEKYRELVETANSIILKLDRKGDITFFNEYAQKFFGYSQEEIMGKNIVGTIVSGKDNLGLDLVGMIQDIIDHPEQYEDNENENVCKNGNFVWVAWNNRAIFEEDGTVRELLCIGKDITDRKKDEEQIRKLSNAFCWVMSSPKPIKWVMLPSEFRTGEIYR